MGVVGRKAPVVARGLRGWRWRRTYGFSTALEHELVVQPGPDGRPGERMLAPSRSFYAPRLTPDGCREDLRVLLTATGSTFAVVCLGHISQERDPYSSARHTLSFHPSVDPAVIEPETVAGEEGVRYRIPLNTGTLLSRKFVHAEWLYVAGALVRRSDDEREAEQRARDILATWQWLS